MNYVELNIPLDNFENQQEMSDILTAMLSEYPYDSFMNESNVLKAYISQDKLVDFKDATDELLAGYGIYDATYIEMESKDWNAEWESEFKSVDVNDLCRIRAPFAPAPLSGLDVVIMPKMSFGTGHHATTCLMVDEIMKLGVDGKNGADIGCGTGVLSIVAVKCGATHVDAVDIDSWAYENSHENLAVNGVEGSVCAILGDVNVLSGKKYDFLLANINRNILAGDMPMYSQLLNSGGDLIMSGILECDVDFVAGSANENGLEFVYSVFKDGWAAIHCVKI